MVSDIIPICHGLILLRFYFDFSIGKSGFMQTTASFFFPTLFKKNSCYPYIKKENGIIKKFKSLWLVSCIFLADSLKIVVIASTLQQSKSSVMDTNFSYKTWIKLFVVPIISVSVIIIGLKSDVIVKSLWRTRSLTEMGTWCVHANDIHINMCKIPSITFTQIFVYCMHAHNVRAFEKYSYIGPLSQL